MAKFPVVAKDENRTNSCLMLWGHMHLNNPCARVHVKKLLGKCSNCKMANCGDVVQLMIHFNVDDNATVTGELPSQNSRKKVDARWIVKAVRAIRAMTLKKRLSQKHKMNKH